MMSTFARLVKTGSEDARREHELSGWTAHNFLGTVGGGAAGHALGVGLAMSPLFKGIRRNGLADKLQAFLALGGAGALGAGLGNYFSEAADKRSVAESLAAAAGGGLGSIGGALTMSAPIYVSGVGSGLGALMGAEAARELTRNGGQ